MCGIAGIYHPLLPKPVDAARVRAMADAIAHRGPDGSGVWTAPGIGLGHRRLSIIDLDGGAQPMSSGDGNYVISFNGEVYNYKALRADLETRGHRFHTDSDTEVILNGWREWGAECLPRLNGMFAFAIHDRSADTLHLVRDRLGVKPLFTAALPDGALIFASELKGLLAHPLLRRAPNLQAVEDYMAFGYVPDDASIVDGVRKIPAGSILSMPRGTPVGKPRIWWDVAFTGDARGSADALGEELIALTRDAVRLRMVADVPLGAFLSGGVDSSAVVALMAENSRRAVETCSIGFSDADLDESVWADNVAARFATSHRKRIVTPDDYGLIDTLVDAFDEPFADASALPTYRVAELAREKVKVALSGDGADEAFAGYRRHRFFAAEERVRGRLPVFARGLLGRAGQFYPKLDWAPQIFRAKSTLAALGRSAGEAYASAVGVTGEAARYCLYRPGFRTALGGHRAEDRYVAAMASAPAADALGAAQYADLKIWLPGDILTKVDRTSMAVGLEAREPLLDYRLVEFAASLPLNMRLRGGTGKWLMKRSLESRLPPEILYRKKMGFVTPIAGWFRGALAGEAETIAKGSSLAATGWFDTEEMSRIAREHRSGRADHARLLWQLLMLDRSLGKLFGG